MKALIGAFALCGFAAAHVHAQERPANNTDVEVFMARYFCYSGDQRFSVGSKLEIGSEPNIIVQICELAEEDIPQPGMNKTKALYAKWKDRPTPSSKK